MKKNKLINNNEIDLRILFEFLLAERLKIFIIIIISTLISVSYNYLSPNKYHISVGLSEGDRSIFNKYTFLNYLVNIYNQDDEIKNFKENF